jgi:hypothetical protein
LGMGKGGKKCHETWDIDGRCMEKI